MNWLRLYTDILDDEKIAQLSDNQYKIFTFLMLMACENESSGTITQDQQAIAWRLRIPLHRIKSAVEKLKSLNIISIENNNITFINWSKRQYKSDNINERVKRYRQKNETLHATDQNRDRTDTDTDTENTMPDKPGISYSKEFLLFWNEYPKRSGSKKAAFDQWKKLNGVKPAIEIILEAIRKQTEWRKNAGDEFRPEWKDPERWIKSRMWEVDLSEKQEGGLMEWAKKAMEEENATN